MKFDKSMIIRTIIVLVAGVGISGVIFKPMGTVATEKNNAQLYQQMKEQAKKEVLLELEEQFKKDLEKVKADTADQISVLKAEYDSVIENNKANQETNLQQAIDKADANAKRVIDKATSPEEIEKKRQEQMKKDIESGKINIPEPPKEPLTGEGKPNDY